jgi:hypothetical protein
MELNLDFLVDNYVRPFRVNRNNRKDILQKLYSEKNLNSIIKFLLTEQGWRNRQFAAICIGVFKLEEFSDQIYEQALSIDEFHAAEGYSFALMKINSTKTKKYLKELSELDKSHSGYSQNVQKWYKAGLIILENLVYNDDDLSSFIVSLRNRIEN